MNEFRSSDEHAPVTYLNGYPLYAAHFVVLVLATSMLATALLPYIGGSILLALLPFDSTRVLHGEVWRVLTYGLVNHPSLWFVIDMFLLASFGREIEKTFGRTKFFQLYIGLYLLTPLLFTLIGLRQPMYLEGEIGSLALFVAFAALYPNAMMMFNVLAKWAAVVLVALYALIDIDAHNGPGLISLLASVTFALGFVRYQQGHITLPSLRLRPRQPNLRVLPDLKKSETTVRVSSRAASARASMAEIDALLDKIAKSGMGSLTPKEREQLERAREELRKKGSSRD